MGGWTGALLLGMSRVGMIILHVFSGYVKGL